MPASDERPLFQYRVDLHNLKPNREYLYVVTDGQERVSVPMHFRTASLAAFDFLVFGDSGTGSDSQAALARRMIEQENPELVLHTGDLSQESGTLEQLDSRYLDVYSPLMARTPFFASPGNHDYYTDSAAPYLAIHATSLSDVPREDTGRYYSFDWGNVHFVSLNSNLAEFPEAFGRMLAWLDADLERQRKFWKVVFFHHPPYPTGHHRDDPVSAVMRDRVVPILERHRVQLVLSGHEHSYQRTVPLSGGVPATEAGTTYVITGGGGGVLHYVNPTPVTAVAASVHHYLRVEVRGAHMTLTAVGIAGEILDTFTIAASSPPAIEAVANAGSLQQGLAGGSIIRIVGRELGHGSADTSVTANGQRIPILSLSGHEITAHLPYRLSGPVTLAVHTKTGTVETHIDVLPHAPAFLEAAVDGRRIPSIWRVESRKLVTSTSTITPGEYVTAYALGLGNVAGPVQAGERASETLLIRTSEIVQLLVGKTLAAAEFAGLTPGTIGIYQVNVRIPPDTPAGATAFRLLVNGTPSEPATLFVGERRE